MSFDYLKAIGSGRLRFRLEIEGWPEEFVSHWSITHATGRDGRRVIACLSTDGLSTGERVVLQEAQLDQDMTHFKLVPPEPKFTSNGQVTDDLIESFTQTVEPVARLGSALAAVGPIISTEITLDGDDVLDDGTVLHVGTEAIRITSWPSVTRTIWGTSIQHHPVDDTEQSVITVKSGIYDTYVYPRPPTMEGRRWFLFAYGEGDDVEDDGEPVGRGIVARPPYLDSSDGVTWHIDGFGITHVFSQKLGSSIVDVHPIGIYHHALCAIVFGWTFNGVVSNGGGLWKLVGFHSSEAEMLDAINAMIADKIATDPIGIITLDEMFESIRLVKSTDGLLIEAKRTSEDFYDGVVFLAFLGSPLLGSNDQVTWIVDGIETTENTFEHSKTYYAKIGYIDKYFDGKDQPSYEGAPISPLGNASAIMVEQLHASVFGGSFEATFQSNADFAAFPPWRIYLDSPIHAEGVHISGTSKPGGLFYITSADNDDGLYWIEVEPWVSAAGDPNLPGADTDHGAQGFAGWLTSDCVIKPVRRYGRGSLGVFTTSVVEYGVLLANIGDSPFVTDDDIGFVLGTYQPINNRQIIRDFTFYGPIAMWDVIREECKFLNGIPRVNTAGVFEVIPLPRWTERTQVGDDYVLDASCILTPYRGGGGMWPTFEQQSDGRVTAVVIQEDYDAVEGEWRDEPSTYHDSRAVSVIKTRGENPISIKPYSKPVFTGGAVSAAEMKARIAETYLAFFSIDYAVVRLQVPFTRFTVLLGDVVAITERNIPDGEGARGVTGRRGVVIQRKVNWDAAIDKMIELTVLLTPRNIVGYAPSGFITSPSPTETEPAASTTWTVTLDPDHELNFLMAADGNVAGHFTVGDRIRIRPARIALNLTPLDVDYQVEGVVTAVDYAAFTVSLELDSAWAPGLRFTYRWLLEFAIDGGDWSAAEKQYAQVSDADLHLQDNAFSRRFS